MNAAGSATEQQGSPLLGKQLRCADESLVTFGALLGTGATSTVYRCTRETEDGLCEELAAKVIDVRKLQFLRDFDREREKIKREVAILASVSHTGVINLHGVVDTDECLVLLIDLVEDGELFNYVLKKGCLSEDEARYVFVQVAKTLLFLHSEGVIHRDLKLENILVSGEVRPGYFQVKVADFGLSKIIGGNYTRARSYVGTPQYWAPEVIKSAANGHSGYDFAADVWSLGCLLYVMVCGTYPFAGEHEILTGQYHFNFERFDRVSPSCLSLIRQMLEVDPKKRITLLEIVNSAWVNAPWPPATPPLPMLTKLVREPIPMNIGPTILGAKVTGKPCESLIKPDSSKTAIRSKKPPAATSTVTDIAVRHLVKFGQPAAPPTKPSSLSEASCTVKQPDSSTTGTTTVSSGLSATSASLRHVFDAHLLVQLISGVFYRFHQAYLIFHNCDNVRREFEGLLVEFREMTKETQRVFQHFKATCVAVTEVIDDVTICFQDNEPGLAVPMFENLKEWTAETKTLGIEMRNRYQAFTIKAAHLVEITRSLRPTWAWHALPEQTEGQRRDYEAARAQLFVELNAACPPGGSYHPNTDADQGLRAMSDRDGCFDSHQPNQSLAGRLLDFVFVSPEVLQSKIKARASFYVEPVGESPMPGRVTITSMDEGGDDASNAVAEGCHSAPSNKEQTGSELQSESPAKQQRNPSVGDILDSLNCPPRPDSNTTETATSKAEQCGRNTRYRMTNNCLALALSPVMDLLNPPKAPQEISNEQRACYNVPPDQAGILIQGVQELQRINYIMEQCTSFWDNLDVTLGMVKKFRDQAAILLQATTARSSQRFLERLAAYQSFWQDLANQCDLFVQGCNEQTALMRKFLEVFNNSMIKSNLITASTLMVRSPPPSADPNTSVQ